ncbi:MAG: hypothetical protein WBC60_00050 [Cognaticolwellia sp.]
MKYLCFFLLIIFSHYSSASENKVKIRIFGGIIEIPSSCVLSVAGSLRDNNRLNYHCESNVNNNYSNTHISIFNFTQTEFKELKAAEDVTNFKVTPIDALTHYTADYNFTIANNEVVHTKFNVICDSKHCIMFDSTDKNILKELLAQFGA